MPTPSKVYGRQDELSLLMSLASMVQEGQSELALVRGEAGTGKSTLAMEFRKLLSSEWLFLPGRYEREASERPYRALSSVIQSLVGALLKTGDYAAVSASMSEELQAHLPLLLDLVPDLQHLLNDKPASESSRSFDSRDAVQTAIYKLFAVVASHHRTVIFLDDLHWAGADSLALTAFLARARIKGLFLLYAFRPPANSHDLARIVKDLKALQPCLVELEGLEKEEVRELLDDYQAGSLTEHLSARTRGNPFFLHSVLRRLKQHGQALTPEALEDISLGDELAEVLVQELDELPPTTARALFQAACHGARFELRLLAEFRNEAPERTRDILLPALETGFLKVDSSNESFQFAHDTFQEASLARGGGSDQPDTHLRWGRLLSQGQSEKMVIAEQLLRGLSEMKSEDEREWFARLALDGGLQASRLSAFGKSLALFQGALRALGKDGRQAHKELYRDLCLSGARAAMAQGRPDLVHELVEEGHFELDAPVRELEGLLLRTKAWMHGGEYTLAIERAEDFMRKVGHKPLSGKSPLTALKELALVLRLVGRRKPADLRELPLPTDPLRIGLQDLESLLTPIYARQVPQLIPLQILSICRMVLTDGMTRSGAWVWTGYGIILCTFLRRHELGSQYAQLSLDQLEDWSREDWCFSAFVANLAVFPWTRPLAQISADLREVYEEGMDCGAVSTAFMALTTADVYDYFLGVELPVVSRRVSQTKQLLVAYSHDDGYFFSDTLRWAVDCLQGSSIDRTWNTADDLETLRVEMFELQLGLVFGQWETVAGLVREIPKALSAPFLGVFQFVHWTYIGVALCQAVEEGVMTRQKAAPGLRRARRALAHWSRCVPERRWRVWWVRAAEMKSKDDMRALEWYDKAIAAAANSGFGHDAALMCEQASALSMRQGSERLGRAYLVEALERYQKWGATAKVQQLQACGRLTVPSLETLTRASEVTMSLDTQDEQLQQLLGLAIEHAGARDGLVLAETQDRTTILAGNPEAGFPAQLVRYVRRTGSRLTVSNVSESLFRDDPYVTAQGSGSLLCWPLIHGELHLGSLFLETGKPGHFSGRISEILMILCAQMNTVIRSMGISRQLHEERQMRYHKELKNVELEARRNSMTAFLGIA